MYLVSCAGLGAELRLSSQRSESGSTALQRSDPDIPLLAGAPSDATHVLKVDVQNPHFKEPAQPQRSLLPYVSPLHPFPFPITVNVIPLHNIAIAHHDHSFVI